MIDPVFGDIPEAFRHALYEAAKLLIRHVRAEPVRAAASVAYLDQFSPSVAAQDDFDTARLAEDLDRMLRGLKGDLKKAPVAAMIAARLASPPEAGADTQTQQRRRRANWLTGLGLVAILERHREDPLENAIREAANEIRLLKRRDPDLLDRLTIEGCDMATAQNLLATMLKTVEAQEADIAAAPRDRRDAADLAALKDARRIRNRFSPIEGLLRACRDGRRSIRRDFRGRREGVRAPMVFARRSDDLECVIDVFETEDGAASHVLAPPPEAERADAPPERAYLARTPETPVYDDLADDRRKTRMAARAEATRALALPSDYDALTPHEARVLVAAARDAPDDAALQFLLAMLVFGRSDRRLALIPFAQALGRDRKPATLASDPAGTMWRMVHGRLHLELRVALPACQAAAEALGRYAPVAGDDEALLLNAPPWLSDRALRTPPEAATLTAALGRLRDRVARPLTRGRLAAHKQLWLRRVGVDSGLIGLLCGLDPAQTAPMHYTVTRAADLAHLHARYLSEALGLDIPPTRHQGWIGSRVRPDVDLVRAVAATLRERFEAPLPPGARLDAIAAAHDAFACHTLLVLMLATAHRPVSAPFERLGDFDPDSGLVWMSDKRTRAGRASRVAMLPPVAVAQYRAWLRHLEALARRLLPFRPDTVRAHVRPAYRPDAASTPKPLFFFLDPAGSVEDATVEAMGDRMADILPLQLNWPRHVLRSRLAADGAQAQALDALLGHGSATEAPFGRHSALTIDDLRPLATRAAALLGELGFDPLESPL